MGKPMNVSFRAYSSCRVPLDKSEGVVKTEISWAVREHRFFAREVEGPRLWNLTVNHSAAERRSTNHRFDLNVGHDSAMRTSRHYGMRERPININGLACADQGHPRAALDANDLRIRLVRTQHPVQSY